MLVLATTRTLFNRGIGACGVGVGAGTVAASFSRSSSSSSSVPPPPAAGSALALLRERSKHVHDATHALATRLKQEDIPYAIAGAVAAAYHGLIRPTQNINVLINTDDIPRLQGALLGRGYERQYRGAKRAFRDMATGVPINVLVSQEFPGDGLPKPVSFPEISKSCSEVTEDGVRILDLPTLIQLKLASAISAPDRMKDAADVQELIRENKLPRVFAMELDPYVRDLFVEIYDRLEKGKRSGRVEA